jgi:hypothetical protein
LQRIGLQNEILKADVSALLSAGNRERGIYFIKKGYDAFSKLLRWFIKDIVMVF